MNDVSPAPLRNGQAAAAENVQHRLIIGEHIGFESRQAGLSGKKYEVAEQEARDPLPAISASGQKSELSTLWPFSPLDGVAAAAKQGLHAVLLRSDHQCRHLAGIDFGELPEFGIRQLLLGAEEAPIDRFPVKRVECFEDARAVFGADGSDCDLGAILQGLGDDIVAWIDQRPGSIDNVITAVYIERLAGDQFGPVHREEGHGDANVLDGDETASRRLCLSLGD